MSGLGNPEAAKPPILTNISNSEGQHIATMTRAPGSTSALLRDAQGRLRARLSETYGSLSSEAMDYIENHMDLFVPVDNEEKLCYVNPQRP